MNLLNSWAKDDTYGAPQYCIDQNGFVHLRGGVDSGSSVTSDITTLPEGLRPLFEQRKLVNRVVDGNLRIQQIRITTGGVIRRVYGWNIDTSATAADLTKEICLDGISFFANQKVTSIGAGSTVSQDQFPSGFPVL